MTSPLLRGMLRALPCALPCALLLAAASAQAQLPIDGTTSGIFVNPLPGTATTTGVGTSTFTFGNASSTPPGPSKLIFTPTSFSTDTETDFFIGSFSFYNGTVFQGTDINTVDLQVGLNFTTPAVGNKTSTFTLSAINNPNTNDPDASADAILLPNSFSNATFEVSGTQYTLELLGFRNVVGDGFLTSDSTKLNVREGSTATAELWGRVTATFPGAVPEPGTWALLGGMTAGFGLMWLRRRKG